MIAKQAADNDKSRCRWRSRSCAASCRKSRTIFWAAVPFDDYVEKSDDVLGDYAQQPVTWDP